MLEIGYNGVLAVAILLACNLILKGGHKAIHQADKRISQLDSTLVPVLCTIVTYVVYGIALIIILDIFGVNTNGLIALLGAAGLGIALALKSTLSNIASGIMLLILRPININEYIECGSVSGKVKEIGLFTTILETPDGLYVSAPNSNLWNAPIKNFTRNGKRRMELVIGISYSDSIEKGIEIINAMIQNESRLLIDPEPQIMVLSLGDSSINLQVRAWANVDEYWNIYWDLNKQIKERIEAGGLTIPFPQRHIHIFNENSLD